MRIRFHVKKAIISQLNRSCIILCAIIFFAALISAGRPLCLSEFFPTSFAQFFVWICAFPLLTLVAGLGIFFDFSQTAFGAFVSSDGMQMVSIGVLAMLCVLVYWLVVRYFVAHAWGLEWVKAATTIVKCFIFWGLFQLLCVVVSCAWSVGGFSHKNCECSEPAANPPAQTASEAQTATPPEAQK